MPTKKFIAETEALCSESIEKCQGSGRTVYVLLGKGRRFMGRQTWTAHTRRPRRNPWSDQPETEAFISLTKKQLHAELTPNQVTKLNISSLKPGKVRVIPRCMGWTDVKGSSFRCSRQRGHLRVLALKANSPMAQEVRSYVAEKDEELARSRQAEVAFRRDARQALLPVCEKHFNGSEERVEAYLAKLGFGEEIAAKVLKVPTYYTSY